MDKTWLEIMNDKACDKLRERLDYLLGHDAEDLDCDDINEVHHIYETLHIIRQMKNA